MRVVDAFVDALDLGSLGFGGVVPEETGRPSYHPATILKIYIYGYLNQVQSSRGLERECRRNLELIWLRGRLAPDFKTIADFRRDNGPAIRKVCQRFVALCRGLDLLDGNIVAIDGSKFKAVNATSRKPRVVYGQCANGRRDEASSDRRARSDEPRLRSRRPGDDGACGTGGYVRATISRRSPTRGITRARRSWRAKRPVSRSPYPSRTPPTQQPTGASIVPTSPMSPAMMPMSARPARLTYRFTNTEAGKTLHTYWTDVCRKLRHQGPVHHQ